MPFLFVFWKPLCLYEIGVRFAYTLLSPDLTRGIALGMLLFVLVCFQVLMQKLNWLLISNGEG